MLNEIFTDEATCRRHRAGPIGPYLDALVADELRRGFGHLTVHSHLLVLGRLGRWLQQRRLRAADLDEARVDEFVRYRQRRGQPVRRVRGTLSRFLIYLRAAGVVAPKTERPRDGIGQLLDDYAKYLESARGLARSTMTCHVRVLEPILRARFGAGRPGLDTLLATDVRSWLVEFASRNGRGSAKDLVRALRSFLRWSYGHGLTKTDLAAAVPAVAGWRLGGVPTTITSDDVARVLRTCDRNTDKGRRDHAVLLLLARLGLRAGEVVSMRLEDIDWRTGKLTLRRKPGRLDHLPLPPDVGAALAAYIRSARPRSSERRVFLCTNAPHRGLGHSSTVSSIVALALHRAGVSAPSTGAHILRHTLASTLLRRGASLGEIGELLGHRSFAATEIYTKVDLAALRQLAPAWPGGAA